MKIHTKLIAYFGFKFNFFDKVSFATTTVLSLIFVENGKNSKYLTLTKLC